MDGETAQTKELSKNSKIEKKPFYHIEKPMSESRVEPFLEAFAAVLKYSDYRPLLDSYCTSSAKCNRCAVTCPVFLATGDPRDIPCYRTNLLLNVYKRYFTIGGWLNGRLTNGFELTEEIIDDMLEVFYRCTACRRCTRECPMGVDHGLITRLGRYILSLTQEPFLILVMISLFLTFTGMWMNSIAQVIIFTPIFLPVIKAVGIDPIHFAIIFVVNAEVGFLTPPLGTNLFVSMEIAETNLGGVTRAVLSLLGVLLLMVLVIIVFPEISLWLPRVLTG